MNEENTEPQPNQEAASGRRDASCSAVVGTKRAVLCCFCGKAWDYTGQKAPEAIYAEAVEHEKQCEKNPYTAEIKSLRTALHNLSHEMAFMLTANPAKDGGLYRQRLNEAYEALANPLQNVKFTRGE